MRILVIGSGGREHALAWKLAQDSEVHAAPGNPGMCEDLIECHPVDVTDHDGLISLGKQLQPDLILIGPENPLIDGLADKLRAVGHKVFGPGADGAQLEGSKAFSKDLMQRAGIPTAEYQTFTESGPALEYASTKFMLGKGVVVKASGNALGKGVVVCATRAEAEDAVHSMLDDRDFGDAGGTIVVEDRLLGREFSLLTLCSDGEIFSLPVAQDYKRAQDGDRGPNTGGMGTYSPVPWISQDLIQLTEDTVVRPAVNSLASQGISYRGILFSGLMVQDGTAYCLEYNVRFGDPETQSVMMRLGHGLAEALLACANGKPIPPVEVKDNAAVTVVVASDGYPGAYEKGVPIRFKSLPTGVKLFHAGTSMRDGQLVSSGGRVLGVTAEAPNLQQARALAYDGVAAVEFEGATVRHDVARV
jgi:phosphoribosylamine---glycine ligase